jgi:DNA-binding helix-hairpin-helix protein with protein kinase domain
MIARLVDGSGSPIRLGSELGKGGEGVVFDVVDHRDIVAKLYHSTPDREKANKLLAMTRGCNDRLRAIAAWPVGTVHDEVGGAIRGFLMPRVARQKDIHVLYGPKTRLRDYPEATYRFLVHVAANLARAFAVIHEHGHVIGDVNQGGVCVSPRGVITLVDCDSFQVRSHQNLYCCDVGVPIYQPPELQHVRSFQGLSRTTNHDNFGLAVLIFQTLFLARHPFAGAFQGADEMPPERAIREFRFAYGRDAVQRKMKQPQGSLGLGAIPVSVAEAFERAFGEAGARGGRPTAMEWVTTLDGFLNELRECPKNSGHAHAQSLSHCPLCELETRTGVLLFLPQLRSAGASPVVDIETLWREVVSVVESLRPPAISATVPNVAPPEAVKKFQSAKSAASTVLKYGIIGSLVLAFAWHPGALVGLAVFPIFAQMLSGSPPFEARDLRGRLAIAKERFNSVLRQIDRERSAGIVASLESRAEGLYRLLREAPRRLEVRVRDHERSRYERQMRRYLDRFEVRDARLPSFGAGLIATLTSNGVETADDVSSERLSRIRGFGPKRIGALLSWRRELEGRFKFDPTDPGGAIERTRLEREFHLDCAKDAEELRRILHQLRSHAEPARKKFASLAAELGRAREELAVLQATASALSVA